ncbi:MAG: hypothetical protein CEE42_10475 [Promethearchaeota archaeon Loki_b31]|nr:MAG: hypothetical protein CEE42_10475 [Candidatus Lokiarchaeota archaeon Loki_b31]
MRKKFSNEKLIKNNKYKLTSCFVLILLTIIIVSNANTAYAIFSESDTETLGPNTASIINIVGCNANDIINVEYEIISGTSLDVYLREGVTLMLMGAPSSYIKKDNDSNQGKWSYTVTTDDSDYSVIFLNDGTESSTVRYTITRGSALGNILDYLYIILIVVAVVVVVGAVIARTIIKKRKSVEPELKSEPTTQTIVKPLPEVEKKFLSCPECGKKLLEGSAFCIECGHQL